MNAEVLCLGNLSQVLKIRVRKRVAKKVNVRKRISPITVIEGYPGISTFQNCSR